MRAASECVNTFNFILHACVGFTREDVKQEENATIMEKSC